MKWREIKGGPRVGWQKQSLGFLKANKQKHCGRGEDGMKERGKSREGEVVRKKTHKGEKA